MMTESNSQIEIEVLGQHGLLAMTLKEALCTLLADNGNIILHLTASSIPSLGFKRSKAQVLIMKYDNPNLSTKVTPASLKLTC